jgi:hypothetical protein
VLSGLNYAGTVNDSFSGAFSLSLRQKSATTNPGDENALLGDTWSLVVMKGGVNQGVLFGEVASGAINWNKDGSAVLKGELLIKGGTGEFADVTQTQGSGWFEFVRAPNSKSAPVASGTINLNF